MGFFERIADFIFRIATGDRKSRWIFTPVVGLLYISVVALFIVAALLTDKWLNLPSISFMPWTLIPALLFLVPGFILGTWTWTMFLRAHGTAVPVNPPQKLITTGIYAYSRNPMMLGLFLILFGLGILIGSLALTIFYTPLFILVFCIYAKKIEEKELELKFGGAYLDYKKKIPMFLPGIGKQR